MTFYSFFLATTLLLLTKSSIPEGYVVTPHGLRPETCVHTPEEQNHIITHSNDNTGSSIYYPDSGRTVFHPALPECVENSDKIKAKHTKRRTEFLKLKKNKNLNKKNKNLKKIPSTISSKSDYESDWGWQIYGGYDAEDGEFQSFTVEYEIPDEDLAGGDQILYFFIGMENFWEEEELTIIQPVIAYCVDGCNDTMPGSSLPGWSGAGWNCCPDGQTWYSNAIQLEAGDDEILGTVTTDSESGVVEVTITHDDDSTELTITDDPRHYNWADVTLEAYDFSSCDQMNSDEFIFDNMELVNVDGTSVDTIEWDYSSDDICDNSIECDDDGLECEIIGNGEDDDDQKKHIAHNIIKYKVFAF